MTKKHLVQVISRKLGMHPNEVKKVVQSLLEEITESLSKGDRLEFRDFGIFEIVQRKQIIIPSRKAVKFTAGKKMKKLVEAETS
jgi:nucleoid DNA-binding protein